MKKQTYIALVYDEDGKRIDFERFACKRTSTVERTMRELLVNCPWEHRWHSCKVFATPDGYNTEVEPSLTFTF